MIKPVVIHIIAQENAMASHRIAAIALTAALTTIMLPMSASFAQPAGADNFEAQVDEAKSAASNAAIPAASSRPT
jgi:hypothetical protein